MLSLLELVVERIYTFYFFWLKQIEFVKKSYDFTFISSEDLILTKELNLLVFCTEYNILIISDQIASYLREKNSFFKKNPRLKCISITDFHIYLQQKIFNNVEEIEQKPSLLFSSYIENRIKSGYLQINLNKYFCCKNISSFFRNFNKKISQKNMMANLYLNLDILKSIKKCFAAINEVLDNSVQNIEALFYSTFQKRKKQFKNDLQKFLIICKIKSLCTGDGINSNKQLSRKNAIIVVDIIYSFLNSSYLLFFEKEFMFNPTNKQMILYQLFIKLSNLYVKKNGTHSNKKQKAVRLNHLVHILSENVCYKFYKKKIDELFSNEIFGFISPFGEIVNLHEYFHNISEIRDGKYHILGSQNFFFSPRKYILFLSATSSRYLKKITYFFFVNERDIEQTGKSKKSKISEIKKILFFIKIKKAKNRRNIKKFSSQNHFGLHSIIRMDNQRLLISKKLLLTHSIYLDLKFENLFIFIEDNCYFVHYWSIRKIQINKVRHFFCFQIQFHPWTMKNYKKNQIKKNYLKIIFISNRKSDLYNLKEKLWHFKLKKASNNLSENFSAEFFQIKSSIKNIPSFQQIMFQIIEKSLKKNLGNIQLNWNGFCIIPNHQEKTIFFPYKRIKYIFYEIDCINKSNIVHFQFCDTILGTNPIEYKNLRIFFENSSVKINLSKQNENSSNYSEMEERSANIKSNKCIDNFNFFVNALHKVSGKNIEIFSPKLGFDSIYEKKHVFLTPTKNSLVCLTSISPIILPFSNLEKIYLERISMAALNFDLVFIFRSINYRNDRKKGRWLRFVSISNDELRFILFLANKYLVQIYNTTVNLNWQLFVNKGKKRDFNYYDKKGRQTNSEKNRNRKIGKKTNVSKDDKLNSVNMINIEYEAEDNHSSSESDNLNWNDLI